MGLEREDVVIVLEDSAMLTDVTTGHEPPRAVARACNVVAEALGQAPKRPEVITFFDEPTNTASHVVRDPGSRRCAIVDSVLDYAAASGRTAAADQIIAFVLDQGLEVEWILQTHVHADHLSAAPYIKERLGGALGICENNPRVPGLFCTASTRRTQVRACARPVER